ncbi:unnamed protein product [Caenorhabditis angaria]|uniref:Uncharacterized protein n=1 Tax=Caenorhabditis angaria TaxID=860376 RepID=A0A9P1NBV7_9PELO|nr:unnamed protein product [Caenorhabditis angaria]
MKSSLIILLVALATINGLPFPDLPSHFPEFEISDYPSQIPGLQIPSGIPTGENHNEAADSEDSEENSQSNGNSKVNLNIHMNGGSGSRAGEGSSNSVVVNFNFNENKQEKEESTEIVEPEFTALTGSPVFSANIPSLPGIPALGGYEHYPLQ